MVELLYQEEVYAVVGAAMEVYNQLGPGFLKAVYQEALVLFYKNRKLHKGYVADYLIFQKIAVEIKGLSCLTGYHESQLINELKAPRLEVGILINFGKPHKLEWKRMIYTPH